MNVKTKLAWLGLATLAAMLLVGWFGYEYRNEAVGFLRALRRLH